MNKCTLEIRLCNVSLVSLDDTTCQKVTLLSFRDVVAASMCCMGGCLNRYICFYLYLSEYESILATTNLIYTHSNISNVGCENGSIICKFANSIRTILIKT